MNIVIPSLCGLTSDEIFRLIEPSGYTHAHAVSVAKNLYKNVTSDFTQFTKIPLKLKALLAEKTESGIFSPVHSVTSADNSVKYLFRTNEGKEFETVYIPDKKRHTVCVSTQSGCRMGCTFCVTGRYGFRGNLTAGEIVNQIISIPVADKITHVVFMGMGEPMDNLENVLRACHIINAEWGLTISSRKITVSTVGIMPAVEKFLQECDCNLTISLYSPFREERKKAIPAETKYPVQDAINLMKNYQIKNKQRFSLAYVMVGGVNDTEAHLEEIKSVLKGSSIRVNLLPYHHGIDDMNKSSSAERMQYFKHNLVISGISASIRKSRGLDIFAACGLLATGLK
jgi:23S rRNA (adenine2503-C2)-methyltransferase